MIFPNEPESRIAPLSTDDLRRRIAAHSAQLLTSYVASRRELRVGVEE